MLYKKIYYSIFTVSLVFLHFSCATKYSISSYPDGASIYSGDKLIGNTPLIISSSDISQMSSSGILLRVEKKNYKRLWAWLPANGKKYNIYLNLSFLHLDKDLELDDTLKYKNSKKNLSRVSDKMLDLQNKIFISKKGDDNLIESIKNDNPSLGSVYYLEAIKKIIDNDNKASSDAIEKAVKNSPAEEDFVLLRNEINSGSGLSEK